MTDDPKSTQVLRAAGCGSLLGSLLVALLLWNLWWVLGGVAVFLGTAFLAAALDAVREIRKG